MRLFSILFLVSFVSCGHYQAERSYLTEMSREDGMFLTPNSDFPVVAGDVENWGYTEEIRRKRTPASLREVQEYDLDSSLKNELAHLESIQSAEAFNSYMKISHSLGTISEKIYYLNLPYHERFSYLESKGLVEQPSYMGNSYSARSGLNLGMSKNEVLGSLGRPERVDFAGNPNDENERWLYAQQGIPQYVYFEYGKVQGWE